jgi:hypothetical protein
MRAAVLSGLDSLDMVLRALSAFLWCNLVRVPGSCPGRPSPAHRSLMPAPVIARAGTRSHTKNSVNADHLFWGISSWFVTLPNFLPFSLA